MLVLQALDEPELRRERMVQSEETYKNVLEIQVRAPNSETGCEHTECQTAACESQRAPSSNTLVGLCAYCKWIPYGSH